jgi:hypothetical protein
MPSPEIDPILDNNQFKRQSQSHIATDSQSVCLPGLMARYLLLVDSYGLVFVGHLL